jgi:hypothetical protein
MIGDDPLHDERGGQEDEQEELRVEQHYAPGAMCKVRVSTRISTLAARRPQLPPTSAEFPSRGRFGNLPRWGKQ